MSPDPAAPTVPVAEHEAGVEAGGGEVPETLLELTDEEVVVLFGLGEQVVATPYLDELPERERAAVLHTAYRSLIARGLMAPAGPEQASGPSEPPQVEVTEGFAALVDIRQGAPVLLCVQRTVADECVLRYAHVVGDFVLVEDVLEGGLHRFAWLDRDRLASVLQTFLVPDDAAPGSGGSSVLRLAAHLDEPDAAGAGLESLDEAVVNIDATVRHVLDTGPGELAGFFLGPGGSWVTRARFGSGGDLRVEPLDPGEVGDLVDSLVRTAEHTIRVAVRSDS